MMKRLRMKPLCALPIFIGLLLAPRLAVGQETHEECLACHADPSLEAETPRGKKLNLLVPEDALVGSVHEDLSCTDCHIGAESMVFSTMQKSLSSGLSSGGQLS